LISVAFFLGCFGKVVCVIYFVLLYQYFCLSRIFRTFEGWLYLLWVPSLPPLILYLPDEVLRAVIKIYI
jgi:hypothetical protein